MDSLCPVCRIETNWKYSICGGVVETCIICQDEKKKYYGYLLSCNHSYCIKCINIMKKKLKPMRQQHRQNNINVNINEWPILTTPTTTINNTNEQSTSNIIINRWSKNKKKEFNINDNNWPSL